MQVIEGRNAHSILPEALHQMKIRGELRASRNGPVLKFPTPATIHYKKPTERVVFWAERDCNPFFHFWESIWMLAGRNDVAFLSNIVARMAEYSDDGETFHGAYGYRWREHFGEDQLDLVVEALKINPDDRRCVVQMWDAKTDLGRQGKDFPCNTQVIFAVNNGALDMSVFNRSNDMVWGALGANTVHFSFLQEYMASRIGVPVGGYWQISNNMHLYTDQHEGLMNSLSEQAHNYMTLGRISTDPYALKQVTPYPLMNTDPQEWMEDLHRFLESPSARGPRDPFFVEVARPMYLALQAFKELPKGANYDAALTILEDCTASDWRKAAQEWILRRKANYLRARDDGPVEN